MDDRNRYLAPPQRGSEPPRGAPGSAPGVSRLHWLYRLALVIAGGILLGLLITASRLQPASVGFGTHRQLGLPPCTVVSLFGIRCPSCGMTTSWSHFLRGQFGRSLQANVGGMLLAAVSLVAGPWLLSSGLAGRWLIRTPTDWTVIAVSLIVLVVTMIDWSVRLLIG